MVEILVEFWAIANTNVDCCQGGGIREEEEEMARVVGRGRGKGH